MRILQFFFGSKKGITHDIFPSGGAVAGGTLILDILAATFVFKNITGGAVGNGAIEDLPGYFEILSDKNCLDGRPRHWLRVFPPPYPCRVTYLAAITACDFINLETNVGIKTTRLIPHGDPENAIFLSTQALPFLEEEPTLFLPGGVTIESALMLKCGGSARFDVQEYVGVRDLSGKPRGSKQIGSALLPAITVAQGLSKKKRKVAHSKVDAQITITRMPTATSEGSLSITSSPSLAIGGTGVFEVQKYNGIRDVTGKPQRGRKIGSALLPAITVARKSSIRKGKRRDRLHT